MTRIEYFTPLQRALDRMKKILFSPFRFAKWFALGFTAWLASLCEGGGSGSGNYDLSGLDQTGRDIGQAIENLIDKYLVIVIVVAVLVFLVALTLILLAMWINSRGKFMFLNNVVHNHTEIKKPWRQFKMHANSLFRWRVVFGLIAFGLIAVIVAIGVLSALPLIKDKSYFVVAILGIALAGILMFITILVLACIKMFLVDFVVPIMYKFNLKCMEAWRMFLPLLREYFWRFILYGLLKILLGLGALMVILVVIIITCCIAGCLMIIPYIGSVLLLPISVTFRSFSVEFLSQFPDFNIFPPQPQQTGEVLAAPQPGR